MSALTVAHVGNSPPKPGRIAVKQSFAVATVTMASNKHPAAAALARIFPSPAYLETKSPEGPRPQPSHPPDLQPRRAGQDAMRLRRKEERADSNGFSRAAVDAVGVGRREAFGVRQLAAALVLCRKQRVCPHMAPFGLAADPNGFSRPAADAVGVGKREAFGVRQLAAALFLCTNNVPGTRSA